MFFCDEGPYRFMWFCKESLGQPRTSSEVSTGECNHANIAR